MLFCIVTFNLWLHFNKLLTYLLTYMKCYVQCSVKANRDTKKEQQPEQTNVNFSLVVSDLEIIEVVETEWHGDTRDFVLSTVQQNGRYAYKMYLKDISADLQTRQNWSRLSPQTSNSTLY